MENRFDIKTLATEWNDMFYKLIEMSDKKPIHDYSPTPSYKNRKTSNIIKLNIASGPNVFPFDGWINYDKEDFSSYFNFIRNVQTDAGMPDHQKKLWQYVKDGGNIDFRQYNFNKQLDHKDNTIDIIYLGQMIEHMSYLRQAPAFIKECYRILKTGGIIRLSTPDIDKLISAYKNNSMDKFNDDQPEIYKTLDPSAQLAMIMFGASGDNCTQEKYEGHFHLYSEKSMTKLLSDAGFTQIEFYNWTGQSKSPIIKQEVVDYGISHSFIVEAVK